MTRRPLSTIDTFVNKVYFYDDKMTVLYIILQDSYFDVDIDNISSPKDCLAELLNPNTNLVCFVDGFAVTIFL